MKKFVAWLLVAIMVVSSLPVAAFAEAGACPGADHAGDHKPANGTAKEIVAPKCGEDGYTVYQCNDCGVKFVGDIQLKPYDHNLAIVEGKEMVPATCDTAGQNAWVYCTNEGCDIANATGREAKAEDETKYPALAGKLIPATVTATREAHAAATTETKIGDCIGGYTPAKHCATCNVTYATGALESGTGDHTWEYKQIVTAPTCTEAGTAIVYCSKCDTTYNDFRVEPLGHTPGALVQEKPASCQGGLQNGFAAHTKCEVCNAYMDAAGQNVVTEASLVITAAHAYGSNDFVVTGGNCTTEPTITMKCDTCSDMIAQTVAAYIEKNPDTYLTGADKKFYIHNWAPITTVDPTCGNKGYEVHVCNDCNEQRLITIDIPADKTHKNQKTDNDYVDPTCASDGYWEWYCEGCCEVGGKIKELNPNTKLDHKLETVTIAPTCKTEGFTFTYCTHGAACTLTTEKTQYQLGEDKIYDLGGSYYLAEFKQDSIEAPDNSLDSKMHKWKDVKHVAATCYVPGVLSQFCELCGAENSNQKLERQHQMVDNGTQYQTYQMYAKGDKNYGHSQKCSYSDCDYVTWDKAEAYAYPVAEHFENYEAILHFHPNAPEKGGAAWTETFEGKPACTVPSIYEATCSCGIQISYKGEVAEHTYDGKYGEGEKAPVDQSYCYTNDAANGWEICTVCGSEESKKEVPATTIPHTIITVVVGGDADTDENTIAPKDATCDAYGWTTGKYCTTCKDYKQGETVGYTEGGFAWLPAIAHQNAVYHAATAATCPNAGNYGYYSCADCGQYAQSEADNGVAGLTWVSQSTYESDIVIPAIQHKDFTKTITHSATCLIDGYTIYHCSNCDEIVKIDDFVKAVGHIFTYTTNPEATPDQEVLANCTEGGYKLYNCTNSVCAKEAGWQLKVDTDSAIGHKNSKGELLTTDCTIEVKGSRDCANSNCPLLTTGSTTIDVIHDPASTVVSPTCSTQGYKLEYCKNGCDLHVVSELKPIDPDKHSWVKADVQETGYLNEVCELCGKTQRTPLKTSNVEYIIKAENADVADGDYAQGSIVKVTLSIKSEYANLNALHVTMNYDDTKVDFLRAEYGAAINPNFTLLPVANGANGVVSYSSFVEGGENYTLTGEQTLAIFYFRIHGSTYAPDTKTFSVEKSDTSFSIDYTDKKTEALDAAAKAVGITQCAAVKVDYTMLTDANADGGLGIADVQYIFSILNGDYEGDCDTYAKGYRAAADVDMDGVITLADARIILYRVNLMTTDWDIFAEICA